MVFFNLQMMVFEVIEAGKGRDVHCDTSQRDQDRLKVSVEEGEVCEYSAGVRLGQNLQQGGRFPERV